MIKPDQSLIHIKTLLSTLSSLPAPGMKVSAVSCWKANLAYSCFSTSPHDYLNPPHSHS